MTINIAEISVAVGCDHAGREYKASVVDWLTGQGAKVFDQGVGPEVERADYPLVAAKVARLVQKGETPFGILVCGAGLGMSMAANRFRGVRAASCTSPELARLARAHNDANVLTLGQRTLDASLLLPILEAFFEVSFEGGRHAQRVKELDEI
ncbi:MAG: ribose 5-phosphate isomerase B [Deltaproteobacteria bacterium]|jgi:ribose 5-phosphate isomerase B|nr:ribose 5-phosphate isomerase B [Deltaproteobacteria bacterium]